MIEEQAELLEWLATHKATIESQFQGRVFGPPEVLEADVLLFINAEGHERFGQIGRLHHFEFTEDIGGNNLLWVDFPDGQRNFFNGLQAARGELRFVYKPLLTEANRNMLLGYDPASAAFLQK